MRPSGNSFARSLRLWLQRPCFVVLQAAVLLAPEAARGQDAATGAVRGLVRDAARAPAVVVVEVATGRRVLVPVGADGRFVVAALAPGAYRVRAGGGAEAVVTVALGATAEVVLERPAVAGESVTVEASAEDAAEPGGAALVSEVLTRSALGQLPLDGRRWQSVAVLTPELNRTVDSPDLLSARGLPSTENSTRLDGVDDDQSYTAAPRGSGRDSGTEVEDETETGGGGREAQPGYDAGTGGGRHPGMAYTFSESAVREFRVTGQNDSALDGHAAGAVITTVSRSGTERLHGSLFYGNRSDVFSSRDRYSIATHYNDGAITTAVVRPHDLRQQFGGTLGGPVPWLAGPRGGAPKLLFFYVFDAQRRGFPAVSSPASASFYALTATQVALLGNRGVTGAQTRVALHYLDSLTGVADRRQDQTIHFGKLEWLPNDRERVSLQYNRARSTSPGGGRTGAVVNRGLASFGNVDTRVDSVVGRWVYARSAGFSNEVRAQYGRDLHLERPQSPLAQEPAIAENGYAPEVAIGPEGLIFGTPASAGQGPSPDERRVQLAEVLTVARGRHLLQMGADWSLVSDHIATLANAAGTFHYDSSTAAGHAGGLVDWISDYTYNVNHTPNGACPGIYAAVHYFCFRSFSQSFGAVTSRFQTEEWAGFVQESWRVNGRLSVNAGARYEYELLPLPQQPNTTLDAAIAAGMGAVGATSRFPEDRNNAGPRLGVAWRPLGSGSHATVLRVGYGLYFGRLPGATVRAALADTALSSTVSRIRITPTVETACPQVANQGFGYPCAFLGSPGAGTSSTTSALVFSRRFRLPVAQQGTFAIEQQLGRAWSVRAAYLLTLTNQLPNSTDLNIAASTSERQFVLQGGPGLPGVRSGETFALPLYTARVSTAFGPVTEVLSNVNASYNAMSLEARAHTRGGLSVHGSFTWSKSIDTGTNPGAVPPTNGQLDPVNVRYDKGLSSLNYPHKAVVTGAWAPRPELARRWQRAVLSGWTVAPVVVETTGRPYSYDIFGGSRLAGGHESINGAGGSVYLPTVGRNTLRMPEQVHVDLRVNREMPTGEHGRLRVTAEVFNLPNRTNVTSVSERAFLVGTAVNGVTPLVYQDAATVAAEGLNTAGFGTPLSSAQSQSQVRQLQLGLRWEF